MSSENSNNSPSKKFQENEELVDLEKDLDKFASKESPKDKVEQVEYNLSSFKIVHIASLMENADKLELNGFIVNAFRNYVCIYRHIRSRFTNPERTLAIKLRNLFFARRINLSKEAINHIQGENYEKFANHIQDMLKKYGFDMKQKSKNDHLV